MKQQRRCSRQATSQERRGSRRYTSAWKRGSQRALAISVGCLLLSAPTPALAVSTCSLDTSTHVATVTTDHYYLAFLRSGDDLLVNTVACGTVATIDRVVVTGRSAGAGLVFNLTGGPFAPGFTDEGNGSSEIEFVTEIPTLFATVQGSSGADSISVGFHRDPRTFENVNDVNLNAAQDGSSPDNDVSFGRAPRLTFSGGAGDDRFTALGTGVFGSRPSGLDLTLYDGPGEDVIVGGTGSDVIRPEKVMDPGDDFSGTGGEDVIDFTSSSDSLIVSQDGVANDGLADENDNIRPDIEVIFSGNADDTITGGPASNTIHGGDGIDTIDGGDGRDTLYGGGGADVLKGGAGTDTVSYIGHQSAVMVTLDGLANDGPSGESDNAGPDVENVMGGEGPDDITGNASANTLYGAGGNDIVRGMGGDDTLNGGGGPTHPMIPEADGSDQLFGGPGNDTASYASRTVPLSLSLDNLTNDRAPSDPAGNNDNIRNDVEHVVGGLGDDRIIGNDGPNRLAGGPGDDELIGNAGNDLLIPGPGSDVVAGDEGSDTISFTDAQRPIVADLTQARASGQGTDYLYTSESVLGSRYPDRLTGNALANVLVGYGGDDILAGRDGNDTLLGGLANDAMYGGLGTDRCSQGPGTGDRVHCEA